MNGPEIFGSAVCVAVVLVVFLVIRRLRRMGRYEHAIRGHLGSAAVWMYDETVMIHFYDHGLSAADAAREMQAARR